MSKPSRPRRVARHRNPRPVRGASPLTHPITDPGANPRPPSGEAASAAADDAAWARFVRRVVTVLGIHCSCSLAVCRRAGACAGRHLPCHAEHAEALRPILRSIIAHNFAAAEAPGETIDAAPAGRDDNRRFPAAERAALARIEAGADSDGHAGDGTAYGFWLRHVVAPHLRRKGDLAPHQDDGSPYDPDASLQE